MKKFLLVIGIVCLMATTASAAPVATVGTLQDYINGGSTGFQIGDKLFYDFTYVPSGVGATPIPATAITVTPITTPGDPGFQFNAGWTAGPGQILDSFIGFQVKVLPGGNAINDVSASMDGFATAPNGVVAVAETIDLNEKFVGTLLLHANGGTTDSNELTFAPTLGILGVYKDISVNGNSGFATVSSVTNQFSEVPVPPSALLLGSGLLGLVGLRFRRRKA